jgi:glycosyltransferase involved in cell wall biosynthesis
MEERISIALASYNGAAYLERQIDSLIKQRLKPAEIIIVDDSSTDGTVALIERLQVKYPVISLYQNTKNLGPIQSFKKAVALCTFDMVALCDQDDIWDPGKLELSLEALNELNPALPGLVYTDLAVIDVNDHLLAPSFWDLQGYRVNYVNFENLLIGNVVTGCTILMNGAMKREMVSMPEEVAMHDHWLALIAYGFGEVRALFETTIKYRLHQHSVTLKEKRSFFSRVALLVKNLFDTKAEYLKSNILQAVAFEHLYGARLNDQKKRQLLNFTALKQKSSPARKLYVASFKLKRSKDAV